MSSILQDGFNLVYPSEIKILTKVIYFLEKGFKSKADISAKLLQKLIEQKNELPVGAVHIDKGKITAGILLFYQGYNDIEKKHTLNLSSWYTDKNYRGIQSLVFAKNLSAALDQFIITNYSPNQAACKIWKALEFKDMNVKKMSFGLSQKFPFINSTIPFKFLTIKKNISKPINIKDDNSLLRKANWYYRLNQTKRISFTVSVLSIYAYKTCPKIDIKWLMMLFYRYRIVKIDLFLMEDIKYDKDIWLIKGSTNVSVIPPIESELVIY